MVMNPFENVIANPRSLRARDLLRDHWLAMGNPQGKLIEAELAWRGYGVYTREERDLFGERSARLAAKHGREWAGKIAEWDPTVGEYNYRMGMVYTCSLSGTEFVAHGAELFRLAPILRLGLRSPLCIEAVCAMPQLAQLLSLSIYSDEEFNNHAAATLSNCRYLSGLIEGGAGGANLTGPGLQALVNSPYLRNVVAFEIATSVRFADYPKGDPLSIVAVPQHGASLQNNALVEPYWEAANYDQLTNYTQTFSWPPSLDELYWTE